MSKTTKEVEDAIFSAFIRHYKCAGMVGPALTARYALSVLSLGDDDGFSATGRLRDWAAILTAAADKLDGASPEQVSEAHKLQCEAYEKAARAVEDSMREAHQTLARDVATAIRKLGSREGDC